MTDIQFYHLTSTPLERALPKLLEKSLQAGLKALVKVDSDATAEKLDMLLWTYDPASFLPHATAQGGHADAQPIYISPLMDAPNHATLLVVTDGSALESSAAFTRVLDIFDGNDDTSITQARQRWKRYASEGHTVSYIKQNAAGGWEKVAA
jgi:DNA polymerase-3 subunit chi